LGISVSAWMFYGKDLISANFGQKF
jgi:hypothetical protein